MIKNKVETNSKMTGTYLSALLENCPDPVWIKDIEGNYLAVNNVFATFCNQHSKTAVVGKTDLDFWPLTLAQKLRDDDKLVMSKKTSLNSENLIVVNGEQKWVETFLSPVLNSKGEVIATTGYLRDISSQKIEEEEKAQTQLKILHSAKLATIGSHLAGITHEINNPLCIITGYIEILKSNCKDVCQIGNPNVIDNLHKASQRMTQIVRGLNAHMRKDLDVIEKVDMNFCIKETILLIADIYKRKNITCEMHLLAQDFLINANMGKMQQVLMNLLCNAKDALKGRAEGLIKITTLNKDNHLLIEISDNGEGISKEVIQKIFEPFFTTKPLGQGTGLGLSLCQTIVNSFGGSISVESEEGLGTTFKILLPST